jgi:hypothetical protein
MTILQADNGTLSGHGDALIEKQECPHHVRAGGDGIHEAAPGFSRLPCD